MMKILDEKFKCTGCSACCHSCPSNCISMVEDNEGFLYPNIDSNKCIKCGKCQKVCPVQNTHFVSKTDFPAAWLVYDVDLNSRKKSAAGGGFSALARLFIEKFGGVVVGAAYTDDFNVKHIAVDTIEKIKLLQKSKYVQSDVNTIFIDIKHYLVNNRYVLFSGTPCQVYGLKAYLGELASSKYLYTIDLSCHGVPSPKVFKKYLSTLEEKENSKIDSFTMRDKQFNRNSYQQGFSILFENGKKMFNTHSQDLFGRCFWGELISRPSCYNCHFKTVWRRADITLGDCWFFNSFVRKEKDLYGVTLALTHSDKGKKFLEENDLLIKYSVPSEDLIKANGGMIYSSAIQHSSREYFFENIDYSNFEKLVNEILPLKKKSKKEKIIWYINRCGFQLEFLRKRSRSKRLKERLNKVIPEEAKGEMK